MATKSRIEAGRLLGLANRRHGYSKSGKKGRATPIYYIWQSMRMRCNNPRNRAFSDYGGRGITVCKKWERFESFLEDMGERPFGASLDRINNNKGYSKTNCRWATRTQQANNTRSVNFITYKGRSWSLSQWAKKLGVSRNRIRTRLQKGMPIRDVLFLPKGARWPMTVSKTKLEKE